MRLETHEGFVADPATVGDIARTVAGLTEVGKAYIIVSPTADSEEYLQAAGTVGENFIVERRDGSAGDHYRADRRLAVDELVAMLTGYLRGTTDWSFVVPWHRVIVDFDAVKPSA